MIEIEATLDSPGHPLNSRYLLPLVPTMLCSTLATNVMTSCNICDYPLPAFILPHFFSPDCVSYLEGSQ